MTINLLDTFDNYFDIIIANNDELKNEAYKLRYQVYCVENMFLNPNEYPDKLESDEFDKNSIQYLVIHRKSGNFIATVRLILPDSHNPNGLFPLEQHCDINKMALSQQINRKNLAEVSRFCITKTFTRRSFTLGKKQNFPYITIALINCIIKASHENNIDYLYGIVDHSVIRFASKLGVNFTKIGPQTDYHGIRWPTVIKITDAVDYIAEKNQDIWNIITNKGTLIKPPLQSPIKVSNTLHTQATID